jgi:4-amino-4-deoxy-L-arabinose transferase-like glycosyltransferase
MSGARWQVIVLLGVAGVIYFTGLGGYDLWPPDEPRFAEVAREMMQSGDYLSPRVNAEPYREKPPLLFWSIAAASQPAGAVTATTARIPSALAALVTILLTYLLARSLFDARVAFWAGIILATTSFFWWEGRSVRTDMLLTLWMTLSLYAFWQWDRRRQWGWLILFWAAVVLAVYTKGPPGLVFPLLLVFAYYWKRPADRKLTHWLLGTLAVLALVALWLIPARMAASAGSAGLAQEEILTNLYRQTIGRLFGVSKAQWPWYFLLNMPVTLLPWSLFLPWTLVWAWRRRREGAAMRLLLCWVVPAFLFFSISIGKRSVYLLPLYPALAILFSASVLELMEAPDKSRWRRRTGAAFVTLLAVLGIAPFVLRWTAYADAATEGLLLLGIFCLIVAAETLYRVARSDGRILHLLFASRFAGLALIITVLALPVVNQYKSARTITAPVRTLARADEDFRLYSIAFSREEYIFYAEHTHTPVLTDLLEADLPEKVSLRDAAKSQRRLRSALEKSVQDVTIADIVHVTGAEWESLRAHVDEAEKEVGVKDPLAVAYGKALETEVGSFATEFGGDTPAFAFVQTEDWRWLLALEPRLRDYVVVVHEAVGSRDVLLVTNAAGSALLTRRSLEARPGQDAPLAPAG